MTDKLIKALAYHDEVRVYVVDGTETVAEGQRVHDTWSTATAALGRVMLGTLLLSTAEKGNSTITVRVQGNGPIGYILADGNAQGGVKSYIRNPHVSLDLNDQGKLDVRGAIGTEGQLSVVKDLGMKEPFVGQVPLISGELAEDFTYYLANSEQTASSVGLSVLVNPDESVKTAGGFMIQLLPGASEETIAALEETVNNFPLISTLMDAGKTPEDILAQLVGDENYRIIDEMPVSFSCDCSKERFGRSIQGLGAEEIEAMIAEDHGAEAVCHFCQSKYAFSEEELRALKP